MSEDNKNLIRQFIRDVFNHHRLDALDELLSKDFQYSSELIKEHKDCNWLKNTLLQVFTAIPDFSVTVESLNDVKGLISVNMQLSGTLKDEFMGITANGQYFSGPGLMIFKVDDSKIQQIQANMKTADYLSQLKKGAIPS